MSTTTINPMNGNNSDKKKSVTSHAATAAAAAGLGVAGTMIADNNDAADRQILDTPQETENTATNPDHQSSTPSSDSINNNAGSANAPATPQNDAPEEPQPITTEEPIEIEEEEPVEIVEEPAANSVNEPNTDAQTTEAVNPDEVAEAIIAEEQVDPNDIDMDDVINFDEIGTVYTVNGESYTAASFHDAAGNQLVMVDVDGDNVFDVVTDMEGNPIIDPNGNLVAAGDITVDDAEINIADSDTYLAANDDDTTDEFGAETIMNDLIS